MKASARIIDVSLLLFSDFILLHIKLIIGFYRIFEQTVRSVWRFQRADDNIVSYSISV